MHCSVMNMNLDVINLLHIWRSVGIFVFGGHLDKEHIVAISWLYCLPIFTLDLPYMHEYNYTGVAQYI